MKKEFSQILVCIALAVLATSCSPYIRGMNGAAGNANVSSSGVSPAILSFDSPVEPIATFPGSQDVTYTVTNSGVATATGMNLISLSSPFSQNGGTCGATLAAGNSCTYIIRFTSPGWVTAHSTLRLNYNNGVTAAQATKAVTGTGNQLTGVGVDAVYSGNSNWNYYVRNNGTNWYNANNTACDGSEVGWIDACIHGGEKRKVTVTGVNSCANLNIEDSLRAFEWICDATSGTATFYMYGLKKGKGLKDLISWPGGATFKNNWVTVYNGIYIAMTSTPGAWWTNPVTLLPDNHLATDPVVTLSSAGTIYALTTDYGTSGYNIANHHISVVNVRRDDGRVPEMYYSARMVDNCNSASGTTTAPDTRCLISTGSQNFVWIEGNFELANNAEAGVLFYDSDFSRIHQSEFRNGSEVALRFHGSLNTKVTDVKISNSNGYGSFLAQNSHYMFLDGLTINNSIGTFAGFVDSTGSNIYRNISASNSHTGPLQINVWDSILQNVVISNNQGGGLNIWGSTFDNHLNANHLTVTNSGNNLVTYQEEFGTFSQIALANSFWDGGLTLQWDSVDNIFSQVAVANNGNYGISLYDSANRNKFTHNLLVGSNFTANCGVGVTTNPGLTAGVCTNQGTSDATIRTGITLANSFVEKVETGGDFMNSSDTDGSAVYNTNLDWVHFDNIFRTWGLDGAAFPDNSHIQSCSGGNCRIWDWRLKDTDTSILNKSNDGLTTNAPFVVGAACPAAVHGNYTLTDQMSTPNTYLVNAQELVYDPYRNPNGNNDGLCENGEGCVYSPNFGAYQGEGSLIGPCTFQNGTVTGVSMYAWSINGVGTSGTLDATFGTSGEYNVAFGANNDGQGFIALQPDGKIITVGDGAATEAVFTISRVLPNGGLDTSFNGGGIFNFTLGAGVNLSPFAITLQRDGKFIVGGRHDAGSAALVMVRFNSDGSTDTGFGNNGAVVFSSGFPFESIKSLAVQADGKILAGAQWGITAGNTSASVFRFHPDGTMDSTFGTSGRSDILAPGGVKAMVVQPDGNILVTGEDVTVQMFVARLLGTNGSLDPSFNGTGIQTIPPSAYPWSSGHSIALQQDGKVVVAGIDQNWGVAGQLLVARLNANGSMDNTFGTLGKVAINLATMSYESINAVKVQSDGRIVLAGDESYRNWGGNDKVFVIRLLPSGAYDNSFGTSGVATFLSDATAFSRIKTLEILPDGRYLTGGAKVGNDVEILRIWQ
jgi:uncharacterized delta-60 repeat protein